MKKFLIFGYDRYYPAGGMHDLVGQFDTLEEVHEYFNGIRRPDTARFAYPHDRYEVYSVETGERVHERI